MWDRVLKPALTPAVGLVVALWLGGLAGLFLSVTSLFAADRGTAVLANPILFDAFGRYQLGLGAAGLLLSAVGYAVERGRRTRWSAVLGLLAVASAGAVAMAFAVGPAMSRARVAGDAETFGRLHGASMVVYLAVTAAVLAAFGALLVGRITPDRAGADRPATDGPSSEVSARRTAPAPAAASASPASPAGRATAT